MLNEVGVEDTNITTLNDDTKMLNLYIDIQSTQSPATAKTYRSVLVNFMDAVAKPMAHVTVEDIHNYAQTIKHLAPSTQNRMLSTVRAFFKFLSQQPGHLLANPMAVFPNPKFVKRDTIERVLTKAEVQRIRDVLRYRNYRDWVILTTIYATGARISEILKADWRNVTTDADGNIGLRVVGKGQKERYLKLSKTVFGYIVNYRIQHGMCVEIGSDDPSPLFANRNGKHITSRYIEQMFHNAVQIAKIRKPATVHWLRHSHATIALMNGADVFKVKESLGHSSINTTMVYVHTINKLQSTTADYVEVD